MFAWSQARIDLPGWFGLGSALDAYGTAHGERGIRELERLYRSWPFLASILDNAELSLARADIGVARQYAALAPGDDHARRWARIETEHRLTVAGSPGSPAASTSSPTTRSSAGGSSFAIRTSTRSPRSR